MTSIQIIALVAFAVVLFVAGIVTHAWLMRQKSPTLTLDAIKAASAILAAAAKNAEADVTAANEHHQAVGLALKHVADRMSAPTAPPVA